MTQNKYQRRWLQWNAYFTPEALVRSILIWQKKYLHENWSAGSVCVRACAPGAVISVFTVFFITCSILALETCSEKNAYTHSVLGLTVWPGSSLFGFWKSYLFKCSSLQVSAFEAGQVTCCVVGDNWLVNCSTYYSLTLCSFQLWRRVSGLG